MRSQNSSNFPPGELHWIIKYSVWKMARGEVSPFVSALLSTAWTSTTVLFHLCSWGVPNQQGIFRSLQKIQKGQEKNKRMNQSCRFMQSHVTTPDRANHSIWVDECTQQPQMCVPCPPYIILGFYCCFLWAPNIEVQISKPSVLERECPNQRVKGDFINFAKTSLKNNIVTITF